MAENLPNILKRVKELIVESLDFDLEPEDIEDEELLFGGQIGIDSVTTLELTQALEDEFGINVEDEELTPELFQSARSLAEFVCQKMASPEKRTAT